MLIRPTNPERVGLIRRASAASGGECRMRFAYLAYKIAACRPDKTRRRRIRRYIPDAAT
ncbi:ribonucleoside diphosphate reductase 1 subunit beta [Escherichia coli]|nr:ribonucleoside diphosphate reductase 1 subunit beta [Escherichia coli]TEZ82786.1 ribonucleoside diphosphate reductase 1 subunit beta [Escherichia coli]